MPSTPRGMPLRQLIDALLVLYKHWPAATVCTLGGYPTGYSALVVSYNQPTPHLPHFNMHENNVLVQAEMQLNTEQGTWAVPP